MTPEMRLTCVSVQTSFGNLYAIVPGEAPLERLRKDDPCWKQANVYKHWTHYVPEICRVRPTNRLKFKLVA